MPLRMTVIGVGVLRGRDWRPETGDRRLETGDRRPEILDCRLQISNFKYQIAPQGLKSRKSNYFGVLSGSRFHSALKFVHF